VELSRDGGGSLDVVEIDAASHNGVDDARDLRERAVFAPARDRFKIFILDEAHMVTQQGFNALLKIVEEPPEHVKFIFATTEPDKVIGTIRSRTHHYPFRLVSPAESLSYLEQLCQSEGVAVDDGVLPLVVRAGGGSVRDTLSILDQLIAGSAESTVAYDRAVALLGYTHGELLAEVVSALAAGNGPATFQALDKVIQTGQDPRRFAEDLLEHVRDIIIVNQAGDAAAALLPGSSQSALDQMRAVSEALGTSRLSAMADVVNDALTAMTGATSPKLHLELLMARLLVTGSAQPERVLQPINHTVPATSPVSQPASSPKPQPVAEAAAESAAEPAQPLTLETVRSAWPAIVEAIGEKKRTVWTALLDTTVVSLADDVVTIGFPSLANAELLKKPQGPGLPVNAELVRDAILAVTGHRVRFKVAHVPSQAEGEPEASTAPVVENVEGELSVSETASWPTVSLPGAVEEVSAEVKPEPESLPEPSTEPEPTHHSSKVGEAVIREVLGGELISEHPVDDPEDR
jgi:DNA polymerase-3 subunit gamma/tau